MTTADYWLALIIGLLIATAIGLIPGIGSVMMLGIALPLVLLGVEEPAIGIVLLAAITGTSNTFDSIPAQLMGIVSSGTQVTFLEGHQLTRKGLGAYSLGAVYAVSAIGGLVGAALLLVLIPVIRPFILLVSFGEIAALTLFGILMVSILSHGAMLKGVLAGLSGLLLSTVGMQGNTGVRRLTFDLFSLENGLPLVATVLGLMALPEMLDLVTTRDPVASSGDVSTREVFRGFREGLRRWKMAVRQSLIGAALGAIPGTGGSVVTWLAYGFGMAMTKDRSEFGKGSLDGLLFAESAENAKEAGQALPTLALGIPGATSWALVLVGMMAYGVTPGPNILTNHADIVGLIVITFALANLILTIAALFLTRHLMRLVTIPYPVIGAAIIPVVILGAYLSDFAFAALPIIAIFTIIGLLMKHYGWPRPPMVLALILGPVLENNLFDAVSVFGGVGFVTRPFTIVLMVLVIGTVAFLQFRMGRVEMVAQQVEAMAEETSETGSEGIAVFTSDSIEYRDSAKATPGPSRDRMIAGGDTTAPNRFRARWRSAHLMPIGFAAFGLYSLAEVSQYHSTRASLLPGLVSSGIVLLALIQLARQFLKPDYEQGQIMDLGLRSTGTVGARSAASWLVACLAIYSAVIVFVGLKYAGVVFAALLPLYLMEGRKRYWSSVIASLLVLAFTLGVGDSLFRIFWPDPIIPLFSGLAGT